jgi:tetratricopeptide (TPR) repeat protein
MRKDNPHYLETLDRVVSLEPMPTISRLEELAQAWLDGKNISKARRLFERALNARLAVGEKVDPSYYINLSELCYQNGKFSKATHYFLKGIEGLPSYHQSISNSDKFELRSLLLGGSSYFSDGYKHLQEIHYKHASESSFKAGEVCEKAKQYEEAAKFFSTTIYLRELCQEKIHPMEHLKIAELFYNCQLYKQALLSFIKGIELLTSNLRQVRPAVDERHAFESAQKVYDECCSGGQFGEAGDLLAKFISVCTKNGLAIDASFHKRVGDAYFRADRFSDAIGAYKEEANLRRGKLPLDADYHKRMGDAHMGAKNFDLAKNSYDNRINALQKDNQSITLACLDAQRACERSTNSVVRQQASKYASMATPVREGDRG